MKKKILSTMLAVSMVAALVSGCSGKMDSVDTTQTNSSAQEGSALKDGKMTELLMLWPGANASPADKQEVEDAMNKIIAQSVDAKVKLQIIEWGAYSDQLNLMLSSGEKLDVFFATDKISDMANRGQLYPIEDLVGTYAKEASEVMSRYIDACYFSGHLYGLPTYRDFASQGGFVCRKDILEEVGLTEEDIKTWDDLEKLLDKVKEVHPDMSPMISSAIKSGCFSNYTKGMFDIISNGVGCRIDDTDESVEILNTYATDEYLEMAKKAYEWNQNGYFMPDSTTNSVIRSDLIKADRGFGYHGNVHPGTVTQESVNSGKEMVSIPMSTRVLSTTTVNFCQWVLPAQCENPEKTLAVLNLLYSNADFQNLFHYGIEGKNYIVKDAEKGIAGYPEGISSENSGWGNEMWLTGNAAAGYAWETDPENVFEEYSEYNDTATLSPLYGFLYDTSNVKNEISAITNVTEKYKNIIEAGLVEPEAAVAKFNEELETAGMKKLIEDVQKQVNEWSKNK